MFPKYMYILVFDMFFSAALVLGQQTKTEKDTLNQSSLEAELAQEMGQTAGSSTGRNRSSLFQNMNPNISVIGTFQGSWLDYDAVTRNIDLSLEETEFSLQAAVDPYAKADVFFSFHKHSDPLLVPEANQGGVDEAHEEGGYSAELEEAFVTVLSMPWSTQLKAGKYRMKFGKLNEIHPHAYNFVDPPYMYVNFFGADGLNDQGLSLSWLIPNKAFFQDLTVQVTSGPGENASFVRAENNRLLYLAHLKNFVDVTENTTLELGLTGLSGPNNADGLVTNMLAADLTLKWKPVRFNRLRSFEFRSEMLWSKRKTAAEDVTSYGLFGFLRYQVARRWFIGGLYDYSQFPGYKSYHIRAFSGILQFFATEFQKVELQYRRNNGNFFNAFNEIKMRAIFVIGSHGAHQY